MLVLCDILQKHGNSQASSFLFQIAFDGFLSTNLSLYSVHLLRCVIFAANIVLLVPLQTHLLSNFCSNFTSEQAEVLFTVLSSTRTTAGIANAITQELRTLPLNLLSEPERYGMILVLLHIVLCHILLFVDTIVYLNLQMGASPGMIRLLKGLAYTSAGMNQKQAAIPFTLAPAKT